MTAGEEPAPLLQQPPANPAGKRRILQEIRRLSSWFVKWEHAAALVILICGFVCAWPVIHGLATTSLWNDETISILKFSSKGPAYVMTHYHIPNNHVFFNLVNSLTLGESAYDPGRARIWSYFSLAVAVTLILRHFTKAGQLFEGSVVVFLLITNLRYLDLILQARGYGLLALGAVVCCTLVSSYFERRCLSSIIVISVAVWLATWTVPTFVFFGGALILFLWIGSKDWRWLVAGLGCLLAIGVSYWPIHEELIKNSSTYAKDWGKEFADWNAISKMFSTYLFYTARSWLVFLLTSVIALGCAAAGAKTAQARAAQYAGMALVITMVVALKLETPAQRTLAFTVVPVSFIAAALFHRATTWQESRIIRMIATATVLLCAVLLTIQTKRNFTFIPFESWMETAEKVEQHFPKNTEVVASFRPQQLRIYLPESYAFTPKFDAGKFQSGKQIVVDSAFWPKDRFDIRSLPQGYRTYEIPQGRGGRQLIYYFPTH